MATATKTTGIHRAADWLLYLSLSGLLVAWVPLLVSTPQAPGKTSGDMLWLFGSALITAAVYRLVADRSTKPPSLWWAPALPLVFTVFRAALSQWLSIDPYAEHRANFMGELVSTVVVGYTCAIFVTAPCSVGFLAVVRWIHAESSGFISRCSRHVARQVVYGTVALTGLGTVETVRSFGYPTISQSTSKWFFDDHEWDENEWVDHERQRLAGATGLYPSFGSYVQSTRQPNGADRFLIRDDQLKWPPPGATKKPSRPRTTAAAVRRIEEDLGYRFLPPGLKPSVDQLKSDTHRFTRLMYGPRTLVLVEPIDYSEVSQ